VYSPQAKGRPGDEFLDGAFYSGAMNPEDDHGGATDFIADLVAATGGKYAPPGTYGLADYLSSVAAERNDYYLLGYSPSADSTDKPCHKLKVKVNRSGLNVNARDSYCTSNQLTRARLTSAQGALEARAAGGVHGNIEVGLQLSWFYSKPDVAVVDIAMDIDSQAMKIKGLHGEFNVLGIAYRQDGSVAARVGDTIKLDFDTPTQLNAFLKTHYRYSKQFNISPGRYNFRMAVGSGDQAFGTARRPLDVAPWSGQTMSVSGIALGVQDYPLTDVTAELDNSMLEARIVLPRRGGRWWR
jgi:hypothetical protein